MNAAALNRVAMRLRRAFVAAALVAAVSSPAQSAQHEGVEPQVEQIIRQTCDTLKEAGAFSFKAKISYDEVLETGRKVHYGGDVETALQRPDSLKTVYRGDVDNSVFFYDGASLTLFDPGPNLYASIAAPPEIDTALELMRSDLGFSLPLSDFYYSDPFPGLFGSVTAGSYEGLEDVGGVTCHRLALSQEDIDWRIWIEEGGTHLPRKLSISYKAHPGAPTYEAIISDWKISPPLEKGAFRFVPPPGSDRIEFLREKTGEEPASEEVK